MKSGLVRTFHSLGDQTEYIYLDNYPLAITQTGTGPSTPEEVIMDNGATGTIASGTWTTNTSNKDYGADHLLADGATNSDYTWTPILIAGDYEVFAWWPAKQQYSSNVPYSLSHNGSQSTIYVDHSKNGNQWNSLGTFTFTGDGTELIHVSDANGITVADAVKFVKVGGSSTSVTYFVHTNHLATPVYLTDAAGQIKWSASYDPFGLATVEEDVDNDGTNVVLNMRFPGQYYDSESGLHYNYYRDYDPKTGRYIQSDPIGLAGGINTYAYVGGNPVGYTDSSGLILDTVADIGFVLYDLYRLGKDNIYYDCDNLGENLTALGLDLSAIIIPGATGLGAVYKTGKRTRTNKVEPILDADAPHTTWKSDPQTGEITRHETWTPNPHNPKGWDKVQSTDLKGGPHVNKKTGDTIPTPHTQGNNIPGGVRSAHPSEVPKGNHYNY